MIRKSFKKLSLAVIVALFSFNLTNLNVIAEPTIGDVENEIQLLDKDIETSMIKVENLNNEIKELNEKIITTDKDIEFTKMEIEKDEKLLDNRIREMYKLGYTDIDTMYLKIIFNSDGFMDILNSINSFKKIIELDNKLISDLKKAEEELDEKMDELKESKKKIIKNKEDIEKELKSLEDKKKASSEKLIQLRSIEVQRNRMYISRGVNFDPALLNLSDSVSDKAKIVIDEAFKHLGTPYVWGGTTPSGFDCSGYMQYIYKSVGVSLPRVSESQQQYGTQVSIYDLKPGDLIFFGYPAYHVGMLHKQEM